MCWGDRLHPLYPLGKASTFVKPRKCLRLRSRHFLGFTQALVFPTFYHHAVQALVVTTKADREATIYGLVLYRLKGSLSSITL